MLLFLAPELIQAISYELNSMEDVKSFRLTCKQTGQALASEILRRITLHINMETYKRELCKLKYLAAEAERSSPPCLAIQGIRQVYIKSLSPARNPDLESEESLASETLKCHEEDLEKYLFKALSSLTTVRAVRWRTVEQDSEWAHTAVVDALKMFPDLQSLSIELHSCRIEIPLHSFTALRHISVHCVGEYVLYPVHHGKTFENFIKMISQSPLLESIEFTNQDFSRNVTRSLHQLFECYPEEGNAENVPPLRLKHLSLANCLVRLDETVMRHLRYLTSLILVVLWEPLDVRPESSHDVHEPISEEIWEKHKRWGSSFEQIWRTIYNADLRLEEVTLFVVPSAFMEYIGSYSGLKKLTVVTGGFDDGVASDNAAEKFYHALKKHADSLEELDIRAYFEGLWCFGHHNKAIFSTFQNLKTLGVRLNSNDFIEGSEVGQPSVHEDIIKILIDTIVTYIPQLQILSASVADSEFNRHHMCGMGTYSHFSYFNKQIVTRVLKYKAPWSCKRLPMFMLLTMGEERVFVSQTLNPSKRGERLRYLI